MKVNLEVSKKTDTNGRSEIILMVQTTVNGKYRKMRAKSGIYIDPVFFSPATGIDLSRKRIIAPDVRKYHLSAIEKLQDIVRDVTDKLDMAKKQGYLTAEYIRHSDEQPCNWLESVVDMKLFPEAYLTKEEKEASKTIWEHMEDYLIKSKVVEGRKRGIRVAFRSMWRYEHYVNAMSAREAQGRRNKPVNAFSWNNIADLTKDDVSDFRDYLENESALAKEDESLFKSIVAGYPDFLKCNADVIHERGGHVIDSRLKMVKAFFNWLINEDICMNNPFTGYVIKSYAYGVPVCMTLSERDQLAAAEMPNKSLEAVRDIFTFATFCGARISDLQTFTEANISKDNVLSYVPIKTYKDTDACPKIPLGDVPLRLIAKYRGVDKRGRLFPFISDQKYNNYLKEVFRIAGLNRMVNIKDSLSGKPTLKPLWQLASSHLARRTFINLLVNQGVSLATIISMSGHSETSKEVQRYFSVGDGLRKEAIKKLDSKEPAETSISLAGLTPEQIQAIKSIIANK